MKRKGIELPGETGRWEEVGIPSSRVTTVLENLQDHRLFRRLPDPPPMPELRVGDWVEYLIYMAVRQGIFVEHPKDCNFIYVVGELGKIGSTGFESIQRVFRDGNCVWEREP